MKVRTRFAPSPTGALHIGGLRTALYSYALAKHKNGDFILRIEDTDKKREVKGAKEKIKKLLKLFNLNWDELYIQSERVADGIYKKAAEKLVADGHAFYCTCRAKNAKEEGFSKELRDPCRDKNYKKGAIKLKVPEGETVSFTDFVLGKEISWETKDVADATLLKSDGFPTYHLAVVVDDHAMQISHVLRGHDWLPSTPIHLLVYKYLGYHLPEIGHLTDILDPAGGKLSKRKGSTSVEGLLDEGFLPRALLNFIMLLGWAPKDNREIFSLEAFVKAFDKNGLQKANPTFNRKKLLWINGEYIRNLKDSEFIKKVEKFVPQGMDKSFLAKVVPLVKPRIKTLTEFTKMTRFFVKEPEVDTKMLGKNYKAHLLKAVETLEKISDLKKEDLDKDLLETVVKEDFHTGNFFMDLRVAITGNKVTPPINDAIVILGKEETIKRLKKLI